MITNRVGPSELLLCGVLRLSRDVATRGQCEHGTRASHSISSWRNVPRRDDICSALRGGGGDPRRSRARRARNRHEAAVALHRVRGGPPRHDGVPVDRSHPEAGPFGPRGRALAALAEHRRGRQGRGAVAHEPRHADVDPIRLVRQASDAARRARARGRHALRGLVVRRAQGRVSCARGRGGGAGRTRGRVGRTGARGGMGGREGGWLVALSPSLVAPCAGATCVSRGRARSQSKGVILFNAEQLAWN